MKKNTRLLLKDSLLCTISSLTILFLLSLSFINISFFNPLEKVITDFSFLDVYYAENFNTTNTISNDIILINVEQISRFEIALLLEDIFKEDPSVVGVDIIFKEKKDAFTDSILAKKLSNEKVVTSYLINKGEIITNHSNFLNKNRSGFVNFNFDGTTHVIREFVGILDFEEKEHFSFSTQIARSFLKDKWQEYEYDKKLGHPNSIKYYGNYNSFLTFTYNEFMQSENRALIKNKIVLLGYIGAPTGNNYDVEDKHFTPLNKISAGKSNPDMYGITIHANILNMLNKNDFMLRISNLWIGIISFLTTFLSVMYFLWLNKRNKISYKSKKKLTLFFFTILFMWLSLWLFKKGIILKTTPIIAITLFSSSFIKYYKHSIKYIQTKRKWKSYIH